MRPGTEPSLNLASAPRRTTGSRPPRANLIARFQELLHYRELVRNLVVSDIKARYKNSVLGFVWSLLNPLAMMLVFTVVFGVLWPNRQMDNYPIFLLCGLLPWNYFAAAITGSQRRYSSRPPGRSAK